MTRKRIVKHVKKRAVCSHEADAVADREADAAAVLYERMLVDRCLAGEVAAWEELYNRCHAPLCAAIKLIIAPGYRDANLIDEIAARVWYTVVKDDAKLLEQFDSRRDLRLTVFLWGLARVEIMQYVRAEQQRRAREGKAVRSPRSYTDWQVDTMLGDFIATLTPNERYFMEDCLLSLPEADEDTTRDGLSDTSVWQRRHRIRSKLLAFFRED